MAEVGVRALKQNASAVVAEAAAGAVVTITDRGRPVARIVPLSMGTVASLVIAGQARPARRRLSELPEPARRRRGQVRLSDTLAADRDAARF